MRQCWTVVSQVIKMLLTIIIVFFVCWGPKLVVNVMKRFELSMLHSETAFFIKVGYVYSYSIGPIYTTIIIIIMTRSVQS